VTSPGWLPCELPPPHPGHRWIYVDPATGGEQVAWCDGVTQPTSEYPCCGDRLCPCSAKGSGWVGPGGAMDGDPVRFRVSTDPHDEEVSP
jgi:hypothetical protein